MTFNESNYDNMKEKMSSFFLVCCMYVDYKNARCQKFTNKTYAGLISVICPEYYLVCTR